MSDEPTRQLEIHDVNWEALSVHAKQGRMVLISADATIEVADLAQALLDDRADHLKAWLADGSVVHRHLRRLNLGTHAAGQSSLSRLFSRMWWRS